MLREWAADQQLSAIDAGDYNFDWFVTNGDIDHDQAYDNMTAQNIFVWVRPETIIYTQDSDFNSVLDFVFVSGSAKRWAVNSTIIVKAGDFPETDFTPDHRPVMAVFDLERP
jgi:hypothetical protein